MNSAEAMACESSARKQSKRRNLCFNGTNYWGRRLQEAQNIELILRGMASAKEDLKRALASCQ